MLKDAGFFVKVGKTCFFSETFPAANGPEFCERQGCDAIFFQCR